MPADAALRCHSDKASNSRTLPLGNWSSERILLLQAACGRR